MIKHILLIAFSLIMIYPLLWLVASSLRPTEVIFRTPGLWLNEVYVENYTQGWYSLSYPFGQYIINSAIVVIGAIAGNLFACTLAAYAFARLKFRLRGLWFAIMLLTLMLPFHVLVVPQYIIFNQLGWVNTFVPLILPKFLATDAFFVFLMVQFIRGIPRELDEAATIDGCGHWQIFSKLMVPLMGPAIATTAIFTFIWVWSDFFTPLIYLTDPVAYTVPVALRSFLDATAGRRGRHVRHVSRDFNPAFGVLVRPAVLGQGMPPPAESEPREDKDLTGKATERKTWYKASMLWSASAKTKNPDAAIAWINWFANDPAAADIDKAERGIPPNSELLAEVTPKLSEAQQVVAKYITDIKTEVANTPIAPPPGGGTLAEVLFRNGIDVLFGRTSSADAAQKFVDEVKSNLKV